MRRRGGRKFPTNLHGNSVRHIGLQGQHVAKVAVVGFGPYVPVSRCVDQLCRDRKSTRLNSSHGYISYAVFCLKKKTMQPHPTPTPPETSQTTSPSSIIAVTTYCDRPTAPADMPTPIALPIVHRSETRLHSPLH